MIESDSFFFLAEKTDEGERLDVVVVDETVQLIRCRIGDVRLGLGLALPLPTGCLVPTFLTSAEPVEIPPCQLRTRRIDTRLACLVTFHCPQNCAVSIVDVGERPLLPR